MDASVEEKELLLRIRNGEVNLYEKLVEQNQNYIFAVVQKYVPREAVTDVAHQAFVDAYRGLDKFRGTSPFRSWVASIAVRRSYDYWREHKRRRREVPMSALSTSDNSKINDRLETEADSHYEQAREQDAARELLNSVLNQLEASDRMIIVLMYLEDRTVSETAAMLGWSTTNTKVRAFRARRRLEKLLKEQPMGETTS